MSKLTASEGTVSLETTSTTATIADTVENVEKKPAGFGTVKAESLTRVDLPDGSRHYIDAAGNKYFSVTHILKATNVPGYGLKRWLATATQQQRDDAQEKAILGSRRGNLLHGKIEDHFTGKVRELTEEEETLVQPYWKSVQPFLKRVQRVHAIELGVVHRRLRYAGSLDFLGEVDGKLTVCDWKTADKKKPDDWILDYQLQACAYAACCRHELGLMVEQAYIVIAIPGKKPQLVQLNQVRLEKLWSLWKRRLERFQKKVLATGKRVVIP